MILFPCGLNLQLDFYGVIWRKTLIESEIMFYYQDNRYEELNLIKFCAFIERNVSKYEGFNNYRNST